MRSRMPQPWIDLLIPILDISIKSVTRTLCRSNSSLPDDREIAEEMKRTLQFKSFIRVLGQHECKGHILALVHVALLIGCAAVIYLASEWFVNAVEWLGVRLNMGTLAIGTVLATIAYGVTGWMLIRRKRAVAIATGDSDRNSKRDLLEDVDLSRLPTDQK